MDAIDIVGALALCTCERDPSGQSQSWAVGDERRGGRRHAASGAQDDRGGVRRGVVVQAHRAHGGGAVVRAVGDGCGCDGQSFVWQTARGGGWLQSAQARAALACLSQLSGIGAETDAGSGCIAGQSESLQSHATGADSNTRQLVTVATSVPGAWRCGDGGRADVQGVGRS